MKRFFATAISAFFLFLSPVPRLSAENLQIVMPRLIYIGDTVEVRYIFHSEANFIGADESAAQLQFRTDCDFFVSQAENFTVTKASLEKHNSEYSLNISLVPWKTGFLQIPPFNISSLVSFSQNEQSAKKTPSFIITLSPIEVKSLVQKTGNYSFLPQANPIVLPGTTAFLIALSILALIVFAALLFILLHLPRVVRFVENFSYLYSLKKNSRKTIKKLLSLQKESAKISSDKDFSEKVQHILRGFLKKRFARDFSSVTTKAFYPIFVDLSGGELGEHQENAVESLVTIFNRLDFVRFSENAKFLSASENGGSPERDSVCENSIHLIEEFDDDSDFEERKA